MHFVDGGRDNHGFDAQRIFGILHFVMFPLWSSAAHHSARLVTKEERREPCGALGAQLEAQAGGMGAQRPEVLEDTAGRPCCMAQPMKLHVQVRKFRADGPSSGLRESLDLGATPASPPTCHVISPLI